ncbi:MAG: hypothetical protein CYPHOPRED_000837 [Cyphobasidiales sp. Tagirdzhanova-0007]|nr:MAG: hypothetical protein CYPHOPRED_000837 [Cyphobasidiales sp. Tagirdzhanova-0007]
MPTGASTSTASTCVFQLSKHARPRARPQAASAIRADLSRPASTRSLSSSSTDTKSKGKDKSRGPPPSTRQLPLRKQFLLEQYRHLFSSNAIVVLLKPADFTVAELTKLRVDLSSVPLAREKKTPSAEDINAASATASLSSSSSYSEQQRPRFTYLRPGLLKPALLGLPSIPSNAILSHLAAHTGNLAVLTLPTLHPPTLKAALKAIQLLSSSPNLRKLQAAAAAAATTTGKGGASPAAASKAQKPQGPAKKVIQEDRLPVLSALVDQKAIDLQQLTSISDLPPLEEVLVQLVGLLQSPARNVIGLAQQAAGGDLVRTLDAFRIGLEKRDSGDREGEAV